MSYIKNKKLYGILIIVLIIVLAAFIVIFTTLGTVRIPVQDVMKIIVSKLPFIKGNVDIQNIKDTNIFIVTNIRLPRILLAVLVGGILSLVGATYQAIFRNPMADPYVMGASSGAAFGATIGTILGFGKGILGFSITSVMAFVGASLTTLLVYNLARNRNKVSTTSILLAGIVISSLLSSIISLMMILDRQNIEKIVTWTMGSFNAASWNQIYVLTIPVIVGIIIVVSFSKDLNAMVTGEENAQNIGVDVEKVKKILLVITSFLAACAVSVSGIIGFVGLIIPHLFRLIFGANHRVLLPVSVVGGGLFLLICDTLARTILNGVEIPVGIITSVFGGPFFLYLLRKSKKNTMI